MKKQDKEQLEAKVDKEQSELLEAELNKEPEEIVAEPAQYSVPNEKPYNGAEFNESDELPNIPVRRV